MGRTVKFTIPIAVFPKQGDRSRAIAPKDGKKPFVSHYKDPEVVKSEEAIANHIWRSLPLVPLKGPIYQELGFRFAYLKKHTAKAKEEHIWKDTKPDLDNLEKNLNDVLESMGFIENDSRIASKRVSKWYGESDCVMVLLREMDDASPSTQGR